ncbi:hypothetical protein Pyn_07617 [Prunus yedoensis var. nudiflora]|uniref:Uncharacterized protein n=1 Tax=Prunus yedoensis var. nudiflora TaxID=2094558 RepID=A0A314UEB5_PRUYE|nr:hypothetical protein Pyn_37740 [Prunus yedoensis var. nudiflora]PQM38800.1 hypothetical protein Pyn_07617 [Prunus yedoensis var. nudiflora]
MAPSMKINNLNHLTYTLLTYMCLRHFKFRVGFFISFPSSSFHSSSSPPSVTTRQRDEHSSSPLSEDQGPRAQKQDKGRAFGSTEGSEGRACPPPSRQGHRWSSQQALQNQGGEAFNSTGVDSDFPEAKSGSKGSLQEQKVSSSGFAPKEDQGHQKASDQALEYASTEAAATSTNTFGVDPKGKGHALNLNS